MDTGDAPTLSTSEIPEHVARRNVALLGLDFVAFGVAMAFLGPTTVLPALVRLLGGSPIVVGSIGTIMSGGWLLPQLFAGRYVANKPLVKKYIVVPGYISRSCLVIMVPALWFMAPRSLGLALAVLMLAYAAFTIGDALSSVAWLDLLGRAVPMGRRGRFTGTAQALSSLLGIGAGVAVKSILARPGAALANHLILIGISAFVMMISATATALVHEPRANVPSKPRPSWGEFFPQLGAIVRRDPRFSWLIAVRWLHGLADMAAAFYALYAIEHLGIHEEMLGLFVSAGVVGSLLSGAILGPVGDRQGSAVVIHVSTALRCLCPALALLAPFVAGWQPALALPTLALLFALAGVVNGAQMTGFTNYVLDIAPPAERSTYISLANTLGGLLTAAPLVAGWLVQQTSYRFLFVVALAMALLATLMSWQGLGLLERWWMRGRRGEVLP